MNLIYRNAEVCILQIDFAHEIVLDHHVLDNLKTFNLEVFVNNKLVKLLKIENVQIKCLRTGFDIRSLGLQSLSLFFVTFPEYLYSKSDTLFFSSNLCVEQTFDLEYLKTLSCTPLMHTELLSLLLFFPNLKQNVLVCLRMGYDFEQFLTVSNFLCLDRDCNDPSELSTFVLLLLLCLHLTYLCFFVMAPLPVFLEKFDPLDFLCSPEGP